MILFLEDKETRESRIDISNENIDVFIGYSKCEQQLNDFIKNNEIFNKYDIIIIHESINFKKDTDIIHKIKGYCKNNAKKLVIFSGNNSQPSLSNNTLTITAKSLYSNIKIFLENYKNNQSNILMLAYGEHWRLNILLNILEKINMFIENLEETENITFNRFKKDYIFKIKPIMTNEEYNNLFGNEKIGSKIDLSQIKIFRDNLKQLIQDKVNE